MKQLVSESWNDANNDFPLLCPCSMGRHIEIITRIVKKHCAHAAYVIEKGLSRTALVNL